MAPERANLSLSLAPESELYRQADQTDGDDSGEPQADEPKEFPAEAVRAAQW